jgi:hypothetical protein
MKAYTPTYNAFAGKWIYDGYRNAWEAKGFSPTAAHPDIESNVFSTALPMTSEALSEDYIVMAVGGNLPENPDAFFKAAENSHKTFLFVQPHSFPMPWGQHPNFVSRMPDEIIKQINSMDNIHLWAFSDAVEGTQFYDKWKKVHCVPLAFDSISYKPIDNPKYNKFDVSFVGGWANNGFDEKKQIIIETFSVFKDSGLKCGFFVNKNLTHQQECDLLANSRITLNIHDAYQRILGHDTNERTFKSLGLNGALVTDSVGQLSRLFPDIKTSSDAQEMVGLVKEFLSLSENELNDIKQKNKQDILDNHCYTNRVEALLAL